MSQESGFNTFFFFFYEDFTFSHLILSLDESRFKWVRIIWRKFTGLIFAFIHVTIFSNGTTACLRGVSSIFFSFPPPCFVHGWPFISFSGATVPSSRKFFDPLCFILFRLFYGRGWGKHNSVGTVMALSSPHQEPGNREEERECSTLMGVWMKADGWGCFHKVPAALEMQARLHFFFARLL